MATDRLASPAHVPPDPRHDVVLESADGKQQVGGELLEVNETAWVLRQAGKIKIYNRQRWPRCRYCGSLRKPAAIAASLDATN